MRAPWIRRPLCVALLALDDACLERQLVDGAQQCLASETLLDTCDLEQHAARLHVGAPPLRRTLTGTHAGFGRLLGDRAVREDVDPDLAATLDVTGHRDTSGLDLSVGHVGRSQRLDAELAERHLGAARRLSCASWVVLLAVLDLAGNQHDYASAPAVAGASLRGPRGPPPRGPRSSRRSGRVDFCDACSRASSLLVMSPL